MAKENLHTIGDALGTWDLVQNILTFLTEDPDKLEVQQIAITVMWSLEGCFNIKSATDPASEDNIGNEDLYNLAQLQVVAEITAAFFLIRKMAEGANTSGTPGSSGSLSDRFLKKVKAGSVESEWDIKVIPGAAGITPAGSFGGLYKTLMEQATAHAAALGCIIQLGEDCTCKVLACSPPLPLKVYKSC